MNTSDEGYVIFSQDEIKEIEHKFKYITLRLVDSCGMYIIAGKEEVVLFSTYIDRMNKLCNFLSSNYNIFGDVITHGESVYIVFKVSK